MENVIGGTGCANNQAPTLGAMRCNLLAVLIGNPLFSKAEQLRANHHAHECEDPQRLTRWLRNVRQEAERRERAAAALVRAVKQAARCDADAPANELYHLLLCPSLTCEEKKQILRLPTPSSKLEAITLVGQYYVRALKRNNQLSEN